MSASAPVGLQQQQQQQPYQLYNYRENEEEFEPSHRDESDPLGGQSLIRSSSLITVPSTTGGSGGCLVAASPRAGEQQITTTQQMSTTPPQGGRSRPGSAIHYHTVAALQSSGRSSAQDNSSNNISSSSLNQNDGEHTQPPASPSRFVQICHDAAGSSKTVVPFVSAVAATMIVVGDHRTSSSASSSASLSPRADHHHPHMVEEGETRTGAATPLGYLVDDLESGEPQFDDEDDDDGKNDAGEFSSPLGDDVEFGDLEMTAPVVTAIDHENGGSRDVSPQVKTNYLCSVDYDQHHDDDDDDHNVHPSGRDDLFEASCDPLGGSGKREPSIIVMRNNSLRSQQNDTIVVVTESHVLGHHTEITIDSFLSKPTTTATTVFDVAALSLQCASSSTDLGGRSGSSNEGTTTEVAGCSVLPSPPRSVNNHMSPRRINSTVAVPSIVASMSSQHHSSCSSSNSAASSIAFSNSSSPLIVSQHRVSRNLRSADRRDHAMALSLSKRSEMEKQVEQEQEDEEMESLARSSSADTSSLTSSPQSLQSAIPPPPITVIAVHTNSSAEIQLLDNAAPRTPSTIQLHHGDAISNVPKANRRVSFKIDR